jgi:hypothetical protein
MDVKLLFLLFIAGAFIKIYDDLNDNNLFEYFNILKEKDYINYLLIGFNYICGIMLTLKLPLCFIIIYIVYLYHFFTDKKAWLQPYEFNGFLFLSLLSLYLLFFENLIGKILDECKILYLLICDKYIYIYYIIITLFITIVYTTYIEFVILINTEFSYKKLISRFLLVIIFIVVFIINDLYFPNIFNNQNYCLIYGSSYLLTSCIFQVILIRKDRIEKSLKKEKKKSKKKKLISIN